MIQPVDYHIGTYAADVESLKNWYCEVLGFQVVRQLPKAGRPPIYFLKKGDLRLELLPSTSERTKRSLNEPGLSHLAFQVGDFTEARDYLELRGIFIEDERQTTSGWKIGYFRDIENNWIEIFEILVDKKMQKGDSV